MLQVYYPYNMHVRPCPSYIIADRVDLIHHTLGVDIKVSIVTDYVTVIVKNYI